MYCMPRGVQSRHVRGWDNIEGRKQSASLLPATALKKKNFICLQVICLKHCELQHELPFMQSAVAGNLFIRESLELKLVNTRDVLTVGREETFKLREIQEYIFPCVSGENVLRIDNSLLSFYCVSISSWFSLT